VLVLSKSDSKVFLGCVGSINCFLFVHICLALGQ
jgi:hypothetical protein